MEAAILEASNAVGRCATEEALGRFDTDGSPIRVGETKLTVRGRHPKVYQSPYGEVQVERYVYQTSRGGRIYCPLEHQGRIIRGATPRFASQLSHKYAQLNVRAVQTDLEQNHGRKIATSYIQHVAEWVGDIAAAKGKGINELAAEIDEARGVSSGLASAIRVYVLENVRVAPKR